MVKRESARRNEEEEERVDKELPSKTRIARKAPHRQQRFGLPGTLASLLANLEWFWLPCTSPIRPVMQMQPPIETELATQRVACRVTGLSFRSSPYVKCTPQVRRKKEEQHKMMIVSFQINIMLDKWKENMKLADMVETDARTLEHNYLLPNIFFSLSSIWLVG